MKLRQVAKIQKGPPLPPSLRLLSLLDHKILSPPESYNIGTTASTKSQEPSITMLFALVITGGACLFVIYLSYKHTHDYLTRLLKPSDLKTTTIKTTAPISVNYHFSRKCNASCNFCFHTATTSYVEPQQNSLRGLRLLKQAGMKKINFAGGEPFLYPKLLGSMVRYCKSDLGLESVSIVTNGSKVTEDFFRKHGQYVDILAVSCDSFDSATNVAIGRTDNGKDFDNIQTLTKIADLCKTYGVMFKLNTVVCRLNWKKNMFNQVAQLAPMRWKVFQVLLVAGENDSEQTKRNATALTITSEQFRDFCARHEHLACFVPEDNEAMKSSYLILDEYMRFLDKDRGVQSRSILDVGVESAMDEIEWDREAFVKRGGEYEWTRKDGDVEGGQGGCNGGVVAGVRAEELEF